MACTDRDVITDTIVMLDQGDPPRDANCPLRRLSRNLFVAADPDDALLALRNRTADLVVVRETVPAAVTLALLQRAGEPQSRPPIVVLAREASADLAVQFIRGGAADYFQGPVTGENVDRVAAALAKRLQDATRRRDRFFAPECPAGVPLVGQSAGLRRTLETINLVAENNLCPVLITGETGAGKELAAQAVHVRTTGGWSNFVAVNCATLTEHLLESDLFGHVRGAFTGADRERTGLFEAAGTGTIFLDEISEMPPNLQARLLRAIQERKFRKVGGTKDIACRATIVASSNRDLLAESRAGRFRRDLYYRLAVLPIALPPLRAADRRDDIPLLADYFIETLGQGRSRVIGLAADAREALLAHDWPGNVRELRNVIERSLLIEKGTRLTRESLLLDGYAPFPASAACHSQTLATDTGPQAAAEDDFSLETAERMFITRALQETGGQRTRAAALLGITRATLHAKLKRYQIDVPGGDGSCEPSHSLAESPADMAC